MSSTKTERFRIIVWPGTTMPLTPRSKFSRVGYRLEGERFLEVESESVPSEDFPGETYLRLGDVDLDDPESILGFVNRYGLLGLRGSGFPLLMLRSEVVLGMWDDRDDETVTLEEFRICAGLIRDAARAWRWACGDLDPEATDWDSPELLEGADEMSPEEYARWLVAALPSILMSPLDQFRARLWIYGVEEGPRLEVRPGYGLPPSSLFSACCLELYNHIVERATYNVCANETCGRLFVRQSGRAEHGQYRTSGVKYCSSSCAKAQAQRMYRRKRKRQSK